MSHHGGTSHPLQLSTRAKGIAMYTARPSPPLCTLASSTGIPKSSPARGSPSLRTRRVLARAEAPKAPEDSSTGRVSTPQLEAFLDEKVFYEGSGSNAETAVSVVLGVVTLLYLPLTITSLGRRAWIKYKFTSERFVLEVDSPIAKRREEVRWGEVASVETVPRCFGLWGDMVMRLKDGNVLQLVGIERHEELRDYVRARIAGRP